MRRIGVLISFASDDPAEQTSHATGHLHRFVQKTAIDGIVL
jgi:hypothetical protein